VKRECGAELLTREVGWENTDFAEIERRVDQNQAPKSGVFTANSPENAAPPLAKGVFTNSAVPPGLMVLRGHFQR
jgi:hypothetical protein